MVVSSARDFDPRVTALARTRINCTNKLQMHPLVREGGTHQETRNRQTENKNLVMGSRWEPDTKTDWPTDRHFTSHREVAYVKWKLNAK
jgi:hypothetical protein